MAGIAHPTDAQDLEVATQAVERQRAYRNFKEPPKGESEPWEVLGDSPLDEKQTGPTPESDSGLLVPTASFDWRARIQISPPRDQASCNACTSFAIAATLEICWQISRPGNSISVSPGYIHTCIGHSGDGNSAEICTDGIDLFLTLRKMRTAAYAQTNEGDYPFAPQACPSAPLLGTLVDFTDLSGPNIVQRSKDWVRSTAPLLADMYMWDDFASYTTNRGPAYIPDMSLGGPWLHCVCIVGFNAAGWIIKNSYGPNWGDGLGYGTIPYGSCGLIGGAPPPGKVPREVFGILV